MPGSFRITEDEVVPLREDFVYFSEEEEDELVGRDIYPESFGTEWTYLVDSSDGTIYGPKGTNMEIGGEGYWRGWERAKDAVAKLDDRNEWVWVDLPPGPKEWRPVGRRPWE
jgi:hypothetical protein